MVVVVSVVEFVEEVKRADVPRTELSGRAANGAERTCRERS